MEDEIKEICKEDNELVVYYEDNSTKTFDTLTIDVLDYITNLQDRIKELEAINEEHRKINGELREKNERLSKDIKKTQYILVEAYALCDEYIKKYNLLQGKSDE